MFKFIVMNKDTKLYLKYDYADYRLEWTPNLYEAFIHPIEDLDVAEHDLKHVSYNYKIIKCKIIVDPHR